MQETKVQSLLQEARKGNSNPLQEIATHSSILARRIPWTDQPGGLQSIGSQRIGHDLTAEQQHPHSSIHPGFWSHLKNVLIFQTLNPASPSALAICTLF